MGIRGESNFSVCLTQILALKCHYPLKETRAREEKVLDEPEISFLCQKSKEVLRVWMVTGKEVENRSLNGLPLDKCRMILASK